MEQRTSNPPDLGPLLVSLLLLLIATVTALFIAHLSHFKESQKDNGGALSGKSISGETSLGSTEQDRSAQAAGGRTTFAYIGNFDITKGGIGFTEARYEKNTDLIR